MLTQDGGEVRRRPVRYMPASSVELNYERLPNPEAFKTMELAYRPVPRELSGVQQTLSGRLITWWTVVAVSFSVLAAGIPFAAAIWPELKATPGAELVAATIGGILCSILAVCVVCFLDGIGRALFAGFLAAVVVVEGVRYFMSAFAGVIVALLFAGGIVAARYLGRSLIAFARDWHLADSRLRREDRAETIVDCACAVSPRDFLLPACFLLWINWLPIPAMGEGIAIGWSVLVILRAAKRVRKLEPILMLFLTYTGEDPAVPGVWIPKERLSSRVGAVAVFDLAFLSAVTLSFLCRYGSSQIALIIRTGLLAPVIAAAIVVRVLNRGMTSIEATARELELLAQTDRRPWWERNQDRLRASKHVTIGPLGETIREAEHVFLGVEPRLHFPILLHRRLLAEHVYIVGRTGSGKTSMGLAQLVISAIRGFEREDGTLTINPVIIIDLKGDEVLFQTAREEAARRGQTFQFFTLEPGRASHQFNPFRGFDSKLRSLPQLAQLILDSLNLNHGPGYGRGYFSQQSRMLLSETLKRARTERRPITSFKDLYERLLQEANKNRRQYRDAFELVASTEALTHYPQLVTTAEQEMKNPDSVIQMDRILAENRVVYFWLNAALESISVREVGKLVLFNLHTAALDRLNAGAVESPPIYLFIDECQKLVGENFRTILQTARSAKIGVTMANQTLEDLDLPDFPLRSTVRTNTRTKLYFSVSGLEEAREIAWLSGEELQAHPDEERETVRPRIGADEILSVSDHPQRLFLHVAAGSGYTQFGGRVVPVETSWPIRWEVAEERKKMSWPSVTSISETVELLTSTEDVEAEVRERRQKKYGPRALRLFEE